MLNIEKIFIGSSSEAESVANEVVGRVVGEVGMQLVPWNTIFKAGAYPLEAFEKTFANELSGAVLLATPDVLGRRGEAKFDGPVANVVLEYGYLAAHLGRKRVAICLFDNVELPSDLRGLTIIKAGKFHKKDYQLPQHTAEELKNWLVSLPRLAKEMPPMRQLHGYSGQWDVHTTFALWKGRRVKRKVETVSFNGSAFVLLEGDGRRGWGTQTGVLYVSLVKEDGSGFRETRRIYNDVISASLDSEGTLTIGVKVRERILVGKTEGTPPDDLREDWLREPDAAPPFHVVLKPNAVDSKCLTGGHVFQPGAAPHQKAKECWTYRQL